MTLQQEIKDISWKIIMAGGLRIRSHKLRNWTSSYKWQLSVGSNFGILKDLRHLLYRLTILISAGMQGFDRRLVA